MPIDRWIDVDRLDAYKKLLAMPREKPLRGMLRNHITQPGVTGATVMVEHKNKCVRHLMYRQLELKGDL